MKGGLHCPEDQVTVPHLTVYQAGVHTVFGCDCDHSDGVGHMSHARAGLAPAVVLWPLKRLADA